LAAGAERAAIAIVDFAVAVVVFAVADFCAGVRGAFTELAKVTNLHATARAVQ